ncbi:RICIN domain-containing protein [Natrinema salifodinae]|uniref:Ricin-type beta-trefoil lectin domain-like n=1 Tax=Natrinema salifodinae TaxID=1202768 RepID=A0A1I0QWD2_9EURY|nr:RICIN domain-containing protein [Natrinema salifodinae]SEW31619.1 Ricin-type beta-trefoil lectin domain-like [Natrinema salifodinae]
MTALGVAGLGAAFGGTASARDRSDDGTQPWHEWDADVDAAGRDLENLGGLDVEHVFTSAREADVVVWRDEEGGYHADGPHGRVASDEELMAAVQAAVDSLSDDRTVKERVLVASSGEVSGDDEVTGVDLPSHTSVDVAGEIVVEGQAGDLFSAVGEENISIPRLTVKGPASRAVFLDGCENVRLGHLWIEDVTGQGVRIQAGCEDVQIDTAYVENTGHHGIETYDVTRIQIGQVIGVDPGSAVVLLNETFDATVGQVVGRNPAFDYATVRLANGCRNVTIGRVVSRGGVRGLSIITGTRDVTVGEVNVVGGDKAGILLVDVRNVTVLGGVIKNVDGPGVNMWSIGLQGTTSEINEGVTLSNLRIVDERPEGDREQTWAIKEDGACLHNRFIDNDVRGGGTEGLIDVASETTVVDRNLGGGIDSGTVTLEPDDSPAARVEGVTAHRSSSLSLRAQPYDAPDAAFAWEHHFEWTGSQWDLVFDWRTDPGADLTLEYVVDRPQGTTDREFDREDIWTDSVPTVEEGTYRIVADHSDKVLEVADGSEATGANVRQGTWTDDPHQRWDVEGGGTDLWVDADRIVAEHSGKALTVVGGDARQGSGQQFTLERYESGFQIQTDDGRLQVADGSTADGANVVEGGWDGAGHQIWRFEAI